MRAVLIVLAAAAVLCILFLIVPSVVIFRFIFGRAKDREFDQYIKETYLEPYETELHEAKSYFDGLPAEEITLTAKDGVRLKALYYGTDTGRVAVLAHGFRAIPMINFCVLARDLHRMGFGILLPYQRAHGASGGNYCGFGLLEQYDLIGWTDMMLGRGAEQILLCGISMGCATVAYASDKITDERVKAMLLDCGYNSPYEQIITDSIRRKVPYKPILPLLTLYARIFLGIGIKTPVCGSLAKTRIPALFLHGTADDTVPFEYTRDNAEKCASPHEVIFTEGADHTISYYAEGSDAKECVKMFINKYFI